MYAGKTQIWLAVSVYVLIAIIREELNSDARDACVATNPVRHLVRENVLATGG